jgi:hypothetical protein
VTGGPCGTDEEASKCFLLDQMRDETKPISSRTLAERIAKAEGKDGRDRKLIKRSRQARRQEPQAATSAGAHQVGLHPA